MQQIRWSLLDSDLGKPFYFPESMGGLGTQNRSERRIILTVFVYNILIAF